jgi:hypothetical protein
MINNRGSIVPACKLTQCGPGPATCTDRWTVMGCPGMSVAKVATRVAVEASDPVMLLVPTPQISHSRLTRMGPELVVLSAVG